MRATISLCWICFSLTLAWGSSHGQDANQIVEQYLQKTSLGDPGVWKSIKSAYMETVGGYSANNFNATNADPELIAPGYSRNFIVWPDKNKIENYDDSTYQNKVGTFYFLRDQVVILISNLPPMYKSPSPEPFFEFLPATIYRITRKNNSVSFVGEEFFKKDSVSYYRIDLTSDGIKFKLYFDKNAGFLRYMQKSNYASEDVMMEYATHKQYGPVMIPSGEVMTRAGVPFYWQKIRKLEINKPISTDEFVYPPKAGKPQR